MTDWQPIETASKDNGRRLLFGREFGDRDVRTTIGYFESYIGTLTCNGDVATGWRSIEQEEVGTSDDPWMAEKHFVPTHWMPLPEPPNPSACSGTGTQTRA